MKRHHNLENSSESLHKCIVHPHKCIDELWVLHSEVSSFSLSLSDMLTICKDHIKTHLQAATILMGRLSKQDRTCVYDTNCARKLLLFLLMSGNSIGLFFLLYLVLHRR